jgi:hypothetical protein
MKYMSSAFCTKESRLKLCSYVAVYASEPPLRTAATECCVGKVSLLSALGIIMINTFRHCVVRRERAFDVETGGKYNCNCASNC